MKIKIIIAFVLILFLAVILRFYNLGKIPPSLDWDEPSLGWNAYSLLKTGTDEYGNAHPVAIRSFNDYKPPLYVYSLVPVMGLLGKTEFSVRFPSALAGVTTVVLLFLITKSFAKKSKNRNKFALCVMLFASINPWLLQFSRIAFEANLALTFFLLGAYFLWNFFENKSSFWLILVSSVSFVLSVYAYHSSRILVPTFIFAVLLIKRNHIIKNWKAIIVVSFLFCVLLFPILRNAVRVGGLQARFDTVSIFVTKPGLEMNSLTGKILASPLLYYPQVFTKNWLSHFDFNFLFLNADLNPRHHSPDMGLLLLMDFPLLILGVYFLSKNRPKFLPWLIILILACPIASALTISAPHAVRALPLASVLLIVSSYGLISVVNTHSIIKRYAIIFAISSALFLNSLYFLHMHFIHAPVEYAAGWQYGYKQMVAEVLAVEDNYDHITITNAYDQPYIYFLFYGRIAPWIKNSGFFFQGMDKYSFANLQSFEETDEKYPNTLYVISPNDSIGKVEVLSKVLFPDGTIAFELVKRIK